MRTMQPWNEEKEAAPSPSERRETKATLGLTDELGRFLMFGDESAGARTPASAIKLYQESTAASIPINISADAFADLEPVLNKGGKIVKEHPVLTRLRNPSPFYTGRLLREVLAKFFLITGEYHIVGLGNRNKPPQQLQPISPASITPARDTNSDAPTAWHVAGNTLAGVYTADNMDAKERVRYFDPTLFRELHTTRNFSPLSNSLLRGQSLLVSASKEARSHVLGTTHNVKILENGGRVSLVFHFEEDMDSDQYQETLERIRETYGGAQNAGLIGVTTGPKMTVQSIGSSNQDMDWMNMQQMAQKAVALQYHIPLPLFTDARQTLNNYSVAKEALYDDAVIPLARVIFDGLAEFLFPRYGLDASKDRLTFDPDQVTTLVARRNAELKVRREIGTETDNEIRAMLGREPMDEGGDVLWKNATMVPVTADLFTDDNEPDVLEGDPITRGTSDAPATENPPAEPRPEGGTPPTSEDGAPGTNAPVIDDQDEQTDNG